MSEDKPSRAIPPNDARSLEATDIYHREFKRVAIGGYDPRVVDEFLTRVADAFETLTIRVQNLEERNTELNQEIAAYREMEDSLRNALATSQRFSEDVVDTAKREADAIKEEARLIMAKAEHEANKLSHGVTQDVRQLREQRERLRLEIMSIIETHSNLLEKLVPAEQRLNLESDEADNQELHDEDSTADQGDDGDDNEDSL